MLGRIRQRETRRARAGGGRPGRSALAAVAIAAVCLGVVAPAASAAGVEPPQGPTAGGTVVTVDAPGAGFSAVSAGDNHSLGLTADGVVYAWGSNSAGQLGADTLGSSIGGPVVVSALAGIEVVAVSA